MSDAQLLEQINAKGLEIASVLAELMASKDVTLEQLSDLKMQGPRETAEERARRYLALVNRARERLLSGTFGACLECGGKFCDGTLRERPWIELCSTCDK